MSAGGGWCRWAGSVVLPLLAAAHARAEVQPLGPPTPVTPTMTLTYQAGDGLEPPPPLDAWWRAAAATELLVARPILGAALTTADLATLRTWQVAIAETPPGTGGKGYRLQLSWASTPAPSPEAIAAVRPPPTPSDIRHGIPAPGSTVDPALPLPAPPRTPGWHLHLAGWSLDPLRQALQEPLVEGAVTSSRRAAASRFLPALDVVTDAATHAVVRLPVGNRWVQAVDPAVLATLPAGLSSACAIGVHGVALANALATLLPDDGSSPETVFPAMPGTPSAAAGMPSLLDVIRGLEGTVVIGRLADGGWCATLPSTPPLDRTLAPLSDPQNAAARSGTPWAQVQLRRVGSSWLLSDTATHADAWLAAFTTDAPPPPPPGAWAWGWIGGGDLAQVLAFQGEGALVGFGYPPELLHHPTDAAPLAPIRALGEHRWYGTCDEEGLQVSVRGPVLPWVPVAIALRAVADALVSEGGRALLARTVAHLSAEGREVLPRDAHDRLPDEATALQAYAGLLRKVYERPYWSRGVAWSWYCYLGAAGMQPRLMEGMDWMEEFLRATPRFARPGMPSVFAAFARGTHALPSEEALFADPKMPRQLIWQCEGAALDLAACGQLDALKLMERVQRMTAEAPDRDSVSQLPLDLVALALAEQGRITPATAAAILAAPPVGAAARYRGMRSVAGALAQTVLDGTERSPDVPSPWRWPFTVPSAHASLASLLAVLAHATDTSIGDPVWLPEGGRSWYIDGVTDPISQQGLARNWRMEQAQHLLLRLALPLVLAAQARHAPASTEDALRLVPALALATPIGRIPLLYTPCSPTAFQLDVPAVAIADPASPLADLGASSLVLPSDTMPQAHLVLKGLHFAYEADPGRGLPPELHAALQQRRRR